MGYIRTLRLFNRNLRLYLLMLGTVAFGFVGLFSLLINLYLLRLGFSIQFIGIFGAAGLLTLALFAAPASIIGTRLGSRRALMLSTVLIPFGLGLTLLLEMLPPPLQPAWLLSTYIVGWIGGTLLLVNGVPYMMENSGPRERSHVFAVSNAVIPLAAFAGAMVGGLLPGLLSARLGLSLDDPAPYHIPMWLSVVAYLVGLVAFLFTDASSHRETPAEAEATSAEGTGTHPARFPSVLIAVMMLILFFRLAAETAATGFFTVYLDTALDAPVSDIGLVTALARLLSVPAALAAPLFIQRLGLGKTFLLTVLALSGSILPLALVPTVPAAATALLGISIASAISITSITLFHQQSVRPVWRTAMSGGANMAIGIGQGFITFAGGFLIAALGFTGFFLGAGALTLVSGVLFWARFRGSVRAAPAEPPPAEAIVEPAPEPAAVQ